MPKISTDEVMTDLTVASEEEPRNSRVVPEFAHDMISFIISFILSACLLKMLWMRSWRQKVFCLSPKKVFCSNDFFLKGSFSYRFCLPLVGCEATGEVSLPSSEP